MAAPCALFASCTEFDPRELVKSILSVERLPEPVPVIEDVEAYPWHIDTKYYTSDIHLCTTNAKTIGDREFSESVQAIVLFFNSDQVASFDLVKSWLPFVKEIEPAVQMLVCDRCTSNNEIPRNTAHNWCLENGFELVELSPLVESDGEEDDFAETTGTKRIIQALHAHTWPNLVMKENPSITSPYFRQLMAEASADLNNTAENAKENASKEGQTDTEHLEDNRETECSAISGTSSEVQGSGTEQGARGNSSDDNKMKDQKTVKDSGARADGGSKGSSSKAKKTAENKAKKESASAGIDSLFSQDMALIDALGNEDPEEESFEHLFERMRVMKEKADTLPPEQRRAYAEKVAISFWKAIGGDEEEIEGLSDSD